MVKALLLSGQYVPNSLAAELGKIPPVFLPVGGKRLFEYQVHFLKQYADEIFVSLPDDYEIPYIDSVKLQTAQVNILKTNPNLRLIEALNTCLHDVINNTDGLIILFGDTYIADLKRVEMDTISAHAGTMDYEWAILENVFSKYEKMDLKNKTLSGLLTFSQPNKLLESIDLHPDGSIESTLKEYHSRVPIKIDESGTWHDFGHVQNYFKSKNMQSTERAFNNLKFNKSTVTKSSSDLSKITAEADWFEGVPSMLKLYTPHVLKRSSTETLASYTINNYDLSTLSDIAVFGDLSDQSWMKIMNAVSQFLKDCRVYQAPTARKDEIDAYFTQKTMKRFQQFKKSKIYSELSKLQRLDGYPVPDIDQILKYTAEIIKPVNTYNCVIHGDLCFSNIFYDFRSEKIQLIDPRGIHPQGYPTIYGPQLYDIAKFAHSIIGAYDQIIAGNITTCVSGETLYLRRNIKFEEYEQRFLTIAKNTDIFSDVTEIQLQALVIQLFLAMLPLHSDNPERQVTIYAIACQLFRKMDD